MAELSGLLERSILTDDKESILLRVVRVEPGVAWLFDMDEELAWPQPWSAADLAPLKKLERRGDKTPVGDSARERGKARYQRFSSQLNIGSLITKKGRSQGLKELRNADRRITRRTWHRAVRDFLRGGMTSQALTPKWHLCGLTPIDTDRLEDVDLAKAKAHTLEKAIQLDLSTAHVPDDLTRSTAAGFERQRREPTLPTLYRCDRETLRVFMHYYEGLEPGKTLTNQYDKMVDEVFSVSDAFGVPVALEDNRLPSQATFRSWYWRLVSHRDRRTNQGGDNKYNTEQRPLEGSERSNTLRAGESASGDATIWNVPIVSRLAGRRAIGPPVVYRIRDLKTGMLLGLSVSLAASSWTGMAAAIDNCLEDKVAFCAKYGIHIQPSDWPVRGLFSFLDVDRGESDNHKPEAFLEYTNVALTNLMGSRGDLKGGSESDFRTLQVQLNGLTPEALVRTWEKSQNKRWKLQGELDLDQFTHDLLQIELARMKKPRDGIQLDDRMTARRISTSPLSMWHYAMAESGLGLKEYDRDELQLSLMHRASGSVTARGLEFKKLIYASHELSQCEFASRSRVRGVVPALVAYDERLADDVFIVELNGHAIEPPIKCQINLKHEAQECYVGRCFAEVRRLLDDQAINTRNAKDEEDSARRNRNGQVAANRAGAKQDNKVAGKDPRSKSAQQKAIPGQRLEEQFGRDPKQAFRPNVPVTQPPTSAPFPAGLNGPGAPASDASSVPVSSSDQASLGPTETAAQREAALAAQREALARQEAMRSRLLNTQRA